MVVVIIHIGGQLLHLIAKTSKVEYSNMLVIGHLDKEYNYNDKLIKHWISCGAVPTHRVQHFLALWNILPKPWYFQRTEEELAAMRKPEEEWTEKDRAKQERKRKSKQREKLDYINYHRPMAIHRSAQTLVSQRIKLKIREKIHAAERQNQILRQLLMHNEYSKLNRLGELAGNVQYNDTHQLIELQQQLANAKAELALIDKKFAQSSPMQKIKVMRQINSLVDSIREVEMRRHSFRLKKAPQVSQQSQTTKEQLDKMLEYQLVVKKLEQMNEDFKKYSAMMDPLTLEEYAEILQKVKPKLNNTDALDIAQKTFMERGKAGLPPLTQYDLQFGNDQLPSLQTPFQADQDEDGNDIDSSIFRQEYSHQEDLKIIRKQLSPQQYQQMLEHNATAERIQQRGLFKHLLVRPDVLVPTNRPVNPFPDLQTYIPEQYYEPIADTNIQLQPLGSLQPHTQLQKYRNKKRRSKEVGQTKQA